MKYSVVIIQVSHKVCNEVKETNIFDNLFQAQEFVDEFNTLQYIMSRAHTDPMMIAMNPLPFAG